MKYQVEWRDEAILELARIWMDESHRDTVTQTANEIDQLLRNQADVMGESRPNGRRILLVSPLGVYYRVYNDDCHVRVLKVWYYPKHSSEAE